MGKLYVKPVTPLSKELHALSRTELNSEKEAPQSNGHKKSIDFKWLNPV